MEQENKENSPTIWIKYQHQFYLPDRFISKFKGTKLDEDDIQYFNSSGILALVNELLQKVEDPVKYEYLSNKLRELKQQMDQ